MKRLAISLSALSLLLSMQLAAAREQYQMTQPPGPPPSAPIGSTSPQLGLVTPVGPDFWKTGGSSSSGILANLLTAGTVMTGTLQEDISSNKSKPGDIFTILLPFGAESNSKQIVPPGAKIIGVIKSAIPAKSLRFGQPGSVEVSLQSLVLPDGRSVRFHGFIDYNANLDPRVQPKVRTAGPKFSDYGSYAKSFLLQFPAGLGTAMNARHRGMDYSLQHDTSVPIRVTANIGVPPAVPPIGYPSQASAGEYQQSLASVAPPPPPPAWTNYQFPGVVPGQTYMQYPPTSGANTVPFTSPAGPGLSRIAPRGAAPEPGYLPATPQLRSELTPPPPIDSAEQGIHATPLRLDDQ